MPYFYIAINSYIIYIFKYIKCFINIKKGRKIGLNSNCLYLLMRIKKLNYLFNLKLIITGIKITSRIKKIYIYKKAVNVKGVLKKLAETINIYL